jgi:hypothetical protein
MVGRKVEQFGQLEVEDLSEITGEDLEVLALPSTERKGGPVADDEIQDGLSEVGSLPDPKGRRKGTVNGELVMPVSLSAGSRADICKVRLVQACLEDKDEEVAEFPRSSRDFLAFQ